MLSNNGLAKTGWIDQDLTYSARFGDGTTAQRVAATVSLTSDGLAVRPVASSGLAPLVWPYTDIRVSEPIRKRSFDAVLSSRAGGRASLYVDDTLLLARLLERAPQIGLGHERWRSARPGLAVGALAFAGYAGIWAFELSPTKAVASMMPAKARMALGDSVIRTMPAGGRCTAAEGTAALGLLTARLMPKGPITADHIVVLDIRMGGKPLVNAFAVPGNRLVLTRGIIEQAQSADEIAAVIGHEAGHVIELHPEASLVRSVGFWALVQMVFTGTPGAIGNVGVLLAQLGYTRVAEREADGHALRLMREASISPKGMADFFRRIDTRQPVPKTTQPNAANDILSSHPSNPERIARIEAQAAYAVTPALADGDWQKLRAICANLDPGSKVVPKTEPDAAAVAAAKAAADRAIAEAKVLAEAKAAADAKTAAERLAEETRLATAKAAAERLAQQTKEAADAAAAAEAVRVTAAKGEADKAAAAKAEADRIEVARVEAAKDATARADAEKAAAREAEAARAAAEAKQKLALATGIPPPPAVAAEKPGPTPFDVRIANANQKLAVNPSDVAALFERGQAYAAKADLATAVGDFTHVLALKPGDANTLFWRASIYARLNETEPAIADYTEVIKLQPKNFAAFNNRGSLFKAQKNLDRALADYSAALAIDGKQAITLTNRALVYREQRQLDQAIVDLNAAIVVSPNYVNAYVRRGETYELKSARDAAIADYRTAMKLPERAGASAEPRQTAKARLAALGVNF